jgi:VWFA-related protein
LLNGILVRMKVCWIVFLVAILCGFCEAQQPFPGEPAAPTSSAPAPTRPSAPAAPVLSAIPSSQYDTPTIHVNTSVVLVPTLVEKKHGDVLFGLQPKDFSLFDNGVPQAVRVDEDMDAQPISLVVCVQRGRDAALEFKTFARLGPLLELFLGDGNGEAALVAFDSQPSFVADFDKDTSNIERQLQRLPPGDGGGAILDAAGFSLKLLAEQPADHLRVLLLISETRDHGSHHITIPQIVQRVGISNTLVLSLTFSPSKAELREWGRGNPSGSLLTPFLMAANAMRKNTPRTLASMSGGEYMAFSKDKRFEKEISRVADHARNRYMLSFHPTSLTPGLHAIDVDLTEDYGARVMARTSYWAVNDAVKPAP